MKYDTKPNTNWRKNKLDYLEMYFIELPKFKANFKSYAKNRWI